jgi:hypothetical protein
MDVNIVLLRYILIRNFNCIINFVELLNVILLRLEHPYPLKFLDYGLEKNTPKLSLLVQIV